MRAVPKFVSLLMWMLPLLFFAYQFILRLWPGLMMPQIMSQFSVNETQFGVLAALYYYGYAGMQIPVAVLLDRFGARRVIFMLAMVCGLAALLFSMTTNWYLACASRFLIGAASACGFLGVSKVISEWFPENQYAKMVGFSFTMGLLGAIYAGKPVSLWIAHYGWHPVALVLSFVAMGIGVCVFLFLRTPTSKSLSVQSKSPFQIRHLKKLLCSPTIWVLGMANFLMVGSLEGFADVWGVQYLMTAYPGLTKPVAAELMSFIFVGMLFGGPLLALLSKKCGQYTVIAGCGVGMALIFVLLLSTHTYHGYWLGALFFCTGILCCYQVIVFAVGSTLVNATMLGVTVAFLNCINMLGGSFFHTVIGHLMDTFWTGHLAVDGVRLYTLHSYREALLVIPAGALCGAFLVALLGYYRKRRQVARLSRDSR